NRGEIDPVPPVHPPGGMVSIDSVSEQLFPSWTPKWLRGLMPYALWILIALALALAAVILLLGLVTGLLGGAVLLTLAVAAAFLALALALRRRAEVWAAGASMRFRRWTPALLGGVPRRPGFQVVPAGQAMPPAAGVGGNDSQDAAAFRKAISAVAATLQAPAPDAQTAAPADLRVLSSAALERL